MGTKRDIYLLSPTPRDGTMSLPMISFETTVTEINFEGIDTLMFTSKQAVITANEIDPNWKNFPSIAIGNATRDMIESLGGEVIYTPKEFYAKELSQDIIKHFSDNQILYLRPKEVSFDSKGHLAKNNITLHEQIIYQTSCINYDKTKAPKENCIIIFTSPSTIKCFLQNFPWNQTYTAVVIGEATKEHLPPNTTIHVAKKPLIIECIKTAKSIL